MLPTTFQALAVALLAIVPGFIATSAWARTKTWKGRGTDLWTVLQSVATSLVIQVLAAPVTLRWFYPVRDHLQAHPAAVALWAAMVVLVIPVLGGVLVGRLSDVIFNPRARVLHGRIRGLLASVWPPSPPPTMWDWLFASNVPDRCFLVVELTDGSRVAGVFARGSYALTSPESPGLFLAIEWSLDDHGNLLAEVPGSAGVMIRDGSMIRSIRILRGAEYDNGT